MELPVDQGPSLSTAGGVRVDPRSVAVESADAVDGEIPARSAGDDELEARFSEGTSDTGEHAEVRPVIPIGGYDPAKDVPPPLPIEVPEAEESAAVERRAPGPRSAEQYVAHANEQAQSGDFAGAQASFERALQIDPDFGEAHAHLGLALNQLGRFAEAERHLRRAIELDAGSAMVYGGLAQAAAAQGRSREAVRHGRTALRLDPGLVAAANNLAWLLATSPDESIRDPEEAIRIARDSLERIGFHPKLLDTLAAGYAAAGRYPAAIRAAKKAEELAVERGDYALAREVRKHLAHYAAHEPYIEAL